ncbi:MAG: tripartite tricarboxylate transporter substrate binding protein [Rhizobiales bacterium]|nr:tripartite tricarboxylate transporter substrate binding protein [Hyphomicrobiales bacterium]
MAGFRIAIFLRIAPPLVSLLVLLATTLQVLAQDFPNRPVKIVVGFGPGGLGDVTVRAVAQKMQASLGKPVVVENMPGAGGMSAAASVARAAPDGHTMLLVSGQNAISPSIFKSMPYDWRRDFAPVSNMGSFDFVIVVPKDSALKSLGDFIATVKKEPAKFNIGTISAGSAQYLTALLFNSMTALNAPVVPFRTTGEVVAALVSGNIQVAFETMPGVLEQIRSGTLRALAVSSNQRAASLPEVPTISESGVPGYNIVSWNGFVVPSKTPRPIVLKLNKEVAAALAAPDVRSLFAKLAVDPRPSSPEELQKTYDGDEARWRKVIADAKIPQQ